MERRRTIATASVLLVAVFLTAAAATAESPSIIKGGRGEGGGEEPMGNNSSTVAITSMRMYRPDPAMKRKMSKASVKLVERPRANTSESCGPIGEEAVIKWVESLPADRRREFLDKVGADCRVEPAAAPPSTTSTSTTRPRRIKCGECKRKRKKVSGSSPPIKLVGKLKKSLPPPPPSVTVTEPLATTTTTRTKTIAAPIGPKILAELAKAEPPTTSSTAPIGEDTTTAAAAATTAALKRKDKSKCRKKKKAAAAATKTSIDNAAADSQ